MRQEMPVPSKELTERVEALNAAFGCTSVLSEFRAAYSAARVAAGREVVAAEPPRGVCPVDHAAAAASLAACPVKHESPAAHGRPALATDVRLKVGPYVRLTALTAELWETMEASREPEITSREGVTYARLHYDGFSLERELPPLASGQLGQTSAFRTVVTIFEGYNRLVTQTARDENLGEGIERTLGGFDEGLLQLAMIFDAIVQAYEEHARAPMPPDQLEVAMKASYVTVLALMRLNYFPQKILDELIVTDINPFTAPPTVNGFRAEDGAGVRASVWDFLHRLGEELFADPSVNLLTQDPRALFEYVLTQLHETVCGPEDRGRKLQGLMLELYKKVIDSIKAAPDSAHLAGGTPLLQQAIARLSKLRVAAPKQRYTQQDAVIVLQRTKFAVDILDLAAGYRESPENRFTVGCTALRAGILKKWYARFSSMLVQWYRLEYERRAAYL